jgi:hypothetical protein
MKQSVGDVLVTQTESGHDLFDTDSNSGLDALATLAASSLDGLELEGLELGESLNVVASK